MFMLLIPLALALVFRADSVPSCPTVFDGLAAKLEANYAGYVQEVRDAAPASRASYERTKNRLRSEAARAEGERCFFVLRALTDSFHDPHLFVYQNTDLDTAIVRQRVESRRGHEERARESEDEARRYLTRDPRHLDPVEGIWRSGQLRVAIVPTTPAATGHYLAVVLTSDSATWRPGEVRAHFVRRPDGGYDADLLEANLAHRFALARVHKRVILRFSPGMWVKELPLLPADSGLADLAEPHRATLIWRGTTPVLSIPSHDPGFRGTLDTLLATNHDAIVRADRLIIDLRGNEGGASWVTNGLAELLRSAQRKPPLFPDGESQMMSSPDQIAYSSQAWQNIRSDSVSVVRLVARMSANPGKLVSLSDSIDSAREAADDAADSVRMASASVGPSGPRRVGILIDGGTVSAAETFLLRAARSTRVRTFGENTEGALDYTSVNIVRVGDTGRRWYLGYPTVASSAELPRGGMKGKGIPPDVRVDWTKIADPIGYVDRALQAMH